MNTRPVTEAQLAANRANATHSTGPKTDEGKRLSSQNALRTGLTGRAPFLSTEEAAAFQEHCARLLAAHKPANDDERTHVAMIADLEWRIMRIPALEAGLYSVGRTRLTPKSENHLEEKNVLVSDSEIYVVYQKEFNNLYLQESRLVRRLDRELKLLIALQQKRLAEEKAQLDEAAAYYRHCIEQNIPYDHSVLAEIGFEFSVLDVQRDVAEQQARETNSPWRNIQVAQVLKTLRANHAS